MARFSIKLRYDAHPENPRTNGNYGHMIYWNDKYNLGDRHNYKSEQELLESLMKRAGIQPEELGIDTEDFENSKEKILSELRKYMAIIPIYLFDGKFPELTSASERQGKAGEFVGYIYMDGDDLEQKFGAKDKDAVLQGLCSIMDELDKYSHYVSGDNFLMEIYKENELLKTVNGFTGNLYDDVIPDMKKAAEQSMVNERVSSEEIDDMFGVDAPQIISDKSYESVPNIEIEEAEEEL